MMRKPTHLYSLVIDNSKLLRMHIAIVKSFYLDEESNRICPDKKEFVTQKKIRGKNVT